MRTAWWIKDYIEYFKIYGKLPDIKKPKNFNEKVLYRKRHLKVDPIITCMSDKYLVRDYVNEHIGDDYLIPLVASLDTLAELKLHIKDYNGYVIKPNHGSGMVAIVPIRATNDDYDRIIKKAKKWLDTDYAMKHGEMQYKAISRKIVVEEFLGDRNVLPIDYKFHIFKQKKGEYKTVLEIISNRHNERTDHSFFIDNFSQRIFGHYDIPNSQIVFIKQAEQLSFKLMAELDYARIDWYIIDQKLYFGEITLTPGAGLIKDMYGKLGELLGQYWQLNS